MTDKLKVGIAGYGVVGKRRREFIDEHPALVTVAVSDRTLETVGVIDGNVHSYPDYELLLNHQLDILFVCMTNNVNPLATIKGLERGMHVFCEKPPGRTVEDIREVCETEKKFPHLKLKYGFNHRYHDSVRTALSVVETGELGKIINIRGVYGKSKLITFGQSSWRTDKELAGGGVLLDQGIHLVDLIRLFAGQFVDVKSFVSNGYWNHDVEDNAYAIMRTAEGVVAMIHSSATQWRHRFSMEITLERGALILSGILSGSKSYGDETLTIIRAHADDRGDPVEEVQQFDHDSSWQDEINEFVQAILDDHPIQSGTSLDALRTMELVYDIYDADPVWAAQNY